jgi:hypothetical protein
MNQLLKKISKPFLFIIFFVLPVSAFCQKLNKPVIDKFSNDTTLSTTQEKVGSTEKFSSTTATFFKASFYKIKGLYFLSVELDASSDNKYFIAQKDDKILLKLANNSIVTLSNLNESDATHQTIKSGFVQRDYWVAIINYHLSKDDIAALSSSALTTVRVQTDQQNFDFDIESKGNDAFTKMLALITSGK